MAARASHFYRALFVFVLAAMSHQPVGAGCAGSLADKNFANRIVQPISIAPALAICVSGNAWRT
jgi:hypothetical protein